MVYLFFRLAWPLLRRAINNPDCFWCFLRENIEFIGIEIIWYWNAVTNRCIIGVAAWIFQAIILWFCQIIDWSHFLLNVIFSELYHRMRSVNKSHSTAFFACKFLAGIVIASPARELIGRFDLSQLLGLSSKEQWVVGHARKQIALVLAIHWRDLNEYNFSS